MDGNSSWEAVLYYNDESLNPEEYDDLTINKESKLKFIPTGAAFPQIQLNL